jgi:O-antigen ligase
MVLTFSRGGLYFLLAIVGLFLYYNRAQMASYFKFLFLVPVALFIYSYVVKETGGKIVERYEQEGASSREILVSVGFELFLRNPVTGVGTGNYNTRIVKEKLFFVESGAHNEFVRAAAEHGVIGLVLYWGFFLVLFLNIIRRRQPQQQYAMYFFVLFCLITVHNGLKISLQPFLLMLAIATTSLVYHKKRPVELRELPKRALATAG